MLVEVALVATRLEKKALVLVMLDIEVLPRLVIPETNRLVLVAFPVVSPVITPTVAAKLEVVALEDTTFVTK